MGLGSRFIAKQPLAGKRTSTLDLEATFVTETVDYIEKFEYGAASANTPSNCSLSTVPLQIVIQACGSTNGEKLTIQFPDNLAKIEYSASGTDAMKAKITLESLATTSVELEDGVTEVITDVYCKLENEIPELTKGGVVMQAP
ncbi:MAG: hypothetical protein FGO69_08715 [Methanobacterium sp.]|nr:MAG: hypothetical protein FGO69_08715 [Methanobacterium sp.]